MTPTSDRLCALLAEAALARRKTGIPEEIRAKARLHIADNLAIMTAARETDMLARKLPTAVQAAGQFSPAATAFLLSAYGHILDFDDIHDLARVHPTAVTLPAALATAELCNASGSDVIDAVTLSNELLCRLGAIWKPVGTGPGSDWFLSQLFGYFAAALAAGIVLRMDAPTISSAFGLAYMQAAGGKEAGFGVGSNARAIYPAFAAMGGVTAALLAQAGVIGPPAAFDGAAGFFPLYFGRQIDADQREQLLRPDTWAWSNTSIKPWPSCRLSHPYVHAALNLRAGLDITQVERVTIGVNESSAKLCNPLERRLKPTTLQDGKYSIPFMVAFALVHGKVDLSTLNETALRDERVLAMAQRTELVSLADEPGLPSAAVCLHIGGNRHAYEGAFNPDIAEPEVRAKFNACFDHAGLGRNAEAAWETATRLESTDSKALRNWAGIKQSSDLAG